MIRRLAACWRRLTRPRHFCFRCDRETITRHYWCQAAFERELTEEWRR